MNKQEIQKVSQKCLSLLENNSIEEAFESLEPVLSQKIPFHILDHAGIILGKQTTIKEQYLLHFLDKIETTKAMGGYVIIASALSCLLDYNLLQTLKKAKEYIIKGDTWYVADIIGERVPGQALVELFDETLPILKTLLRETNPWVKRSAGVAIHYHTKRVRNEREKAQQLLNLLSPYFEEKDTRIVKGIGWGLKTLGRYYPDLVVSFLKSKKGTKPTSIMMKKALTYLPTEKKLAIKAILS